MDQCGDTRRILFSGTATSFGVVEGTVLNFNGTNRFSASGPTTFSVTSFSNAFLAEISMDTPGPATYSVTRFASMDPNFFYQAFFNSTRCWRPPRLPIRGIRFCSPA